MMNTHNQRIVGGAIGLLIITSGVLVFATRDNSQIGSPGVIFGILFLIGAVMLVTGRLRLLGTLAITGRQARIMGFFWVLPLLTSYALQMTANDTLRDLAPQVITVEMLLAVVVAIIVLALTLKTAEQDAPPDDTWWHN